MATDFSAPARHAAERAARMAQATQAAVALLHVLPGSTLEQLRQWLGTDTPQEQRLREDTEAALRDLARGLQERHGVPVTTSQRSGVALEEIHGKAEALDAALVVVGARGAGFMRRLMLGTTAERLLRRTQRPVLVVRQTPHEAYGRVLVAIDFSPWSAHALALARRVTPQARLVLLSAWQVPFEGQLRLAGVDEATFQHYRMQSRLEATRQVHELAAAQGLQPSQWQACVVEGEASRCILEQEQELDCDLVVLGKHGRSMTEDLLLGSVSKHVLAEGSADVLVSTARSG